MDLHSFKEYVNATLSIDAEYKRIFGREIPSGRFFCPFHVNVNTPAAKRYFNGIKCFSCNRFYTVYDLLYAYDKKRLEELKGSMIIEPIKSTTLQTQRRIKVIQYNDDDSIKNILTQILEANEIDAIQQHQSYSLPY